MTIFQYILGFIFLLAGIATVVFWILSLVQIFTRKDLQNNKWLWFLVIFFIAPIGSIVYFFVEKRKKLGIWMLITTVLVPVILSAWAILVFIQNNIT